MLHGLFVLDRECRGHVRGPFFSGPFRVSHSRNQLMYPSRIEHDFHGLVRPHDRCCRVHADPGHLLRRKPKPRSYRAPEFDELMGLESFTSVFT